MAQFLFTCFLSGSFCSYSENIAWISSPSDGVDALLKSTQLTGWLCSRILEGCRVYPSHLLTQLTTSPSTHFICYCWLWSNSRVYAFPQGAASGGGLITTTQACQKKIKGPAQVPGQRDCEPQQIIEQLIGTLDQRWAN